MDARIRRQTPQPLQVLSMPTCIYVHIHSCGGYVCLVSTHTCTLPPTPKKKQKSIDIPLCWQLEKVALIFLKTVYGTEADASVDCLPLRSGNALSMWSMMEREVCNSGAEGLCVFDPSTPKLPSAHVLRRRDSGRYVVWFGLPWNAEMKFTLLV